MGGENMREKGKNRKEKKILIRVSRDEKNLAEELSKKDGKNTSEFFRYLIKEHAEKQRMEKHLDIINRYEELLQKYAKLLEDIKKPPPQ
jgi:hypothetical protein